MLFGLDIGFGNFKLTGPAGSVVLPAMVAANTGTHTVDVLAGSVKPPMEVNVDGQAYFVGLGSHNWGEALEDLSYDRLLGSPIVRALFYGVFSLYAKKYKVDLSAESLELYAGVPYGLAQIGDVKELVKEMKKWIRGSHDWQIGKKAFEIEVGSVVFMSQAHAAWSNWGFTGIGTENGQSPIGIKRPFSTSF